MVGNLRLPRIVWPLLSALGLIAAWAIWRYPLFPLHGNYQWGFLLLILGIIVIAIAAIRDSRNVMASVPIGYLGGFLLGILIDPQRQVFADGHLVETAHDWWVIWTLAYLAVIALGFICEIITRRWFKR